MYLECYLFLYCFSNDFETYERILVQFVWSFFEHVCAWCNHVEKKVTSFRRTSFSTPLIFHSYGITRLVRLSRITKTKTKISCLSIHTVSVGVTRPGGNNLTYLTLPPLIISGMINHPSSEVRVYGRSPSGWPFVIFNVER